MYTSNLIQLLQMLNGTRKNWVVYISSSQADAFRTGEPWEARLSLTEGRVTCRIWSTVDRRLLLSNEEAIRWLADLPQFVWRLETTISPQGSQETLLPWIPQRVEQVEKTAINALSREQRQILGLVDGRRTAKEIATILQQPLDALEKVLDDLRARGFIRQ
jgi:hypothetical protein